MAVVAMSGARRNSCANLAVRPSGRYTFCFGWAPGGRFGVLLFLAFFSCLLPSSSPFVYYPSCSPELHLSRGVQDEYHLLTHVVSSRSPLDYSRVFSPLPFEILSHLSDPLLRFPAAQRGPITDIPQPYPPNYFFTSITTPSYTPYHLSRHTHNSTHTHYPVRFARPRPNMPPTYSPCPRPILKKQCSPPSSPTPATTLPRDESAQLLNIDPSVLQSLVRFPPTNTLCRTFVADSPSIYDRSPIVVTPNKCKLPERGCPGRTYLPGDSATRSPSKAAGSKVHERSDASGRHLHPRAVRVHIPRESGDDEDDELTPRVTYSHPLPPLVPDFSSSSESDESDGFSSPPLECAPMCKCLRFSFLASHPPSFLIFLHAAVFPSHFRFAVFVC